jgi:DNA-binding NarL/FixJ family response regulator
MILIVASSRAKSTRIRAALPAGIVSQCVTEWHAACQAAPTAGCIVLELTVPDGEVFVDQVRSLRRVAPGVAVVAVAPLQTSAVRYAMRAGVDDFVSFETLDGEAWQVIREARARTLRQEVISLVRSAGRLSEDLRDAMIRAIDSDKMPRTAAALALLSRLSRTALYRSTTSGSSTKSRGRVVREVLDWIALVHCVSRKRRDLSWDAVARAVNTDIRTLRAIARRRTGLTLVELQEPGRAKLLDECRKWTAISSA